MSAPSIRRSLLIRCGIGVGVLMCLLSITVYLLVRRGLYLEMDRSITQTAALLSNQIELENDRINFEWQEGLGTNDMLALEGLFQFWDDHSGASTRSPALHTLDLPNFHGADGAPLVKTIELANGDLARAVGLQVYPFVLPEERARMEERGRVIDPKNMPHTMVVARNMAPMQRTLKHLRFVLITGTLLTLALGFSLIDHVIAVSLRPIDSLTRQMHERSGKQLDCALALPGELPTELGGLARNFDALLARVAASRQRERDFIRHAAHELRTPIAGMLATIDLALSQSRAVTDYVGFLTTCQKSATGMGELVKRLSALARIGIHAASSTSLKPVTPADVLTECAALYQNAFESRQLALTLACEPGVQAMADPALLRLILTNLFDNATSYGSIGGQVGVSCRRVDDRVRLSISNTADNLPDDLDRLFEPLFRQESTDGDSGSHLGIGLTLSHEAARAMGATLQVQRCAANLVEFTVDLPAA